MRMKEPPNQCWTVIDTNGIVMCGHCSCMAGMGEVCSHVSAILFALEDWGRKSSNVPNSVCKQRTYKTLCCLCSFFVLFCEDI